MGNRIIVVMLVFSLLSSVGMTILADTEQYDDTMDPLITIEYDPEAVINNLETFDPIMPSFDPYTGVTVVNENVSIQKRQSSRVANDIYGNVYVVWMDVRDNVWDIHLAISNNNGTTFDTEINLSADGVTQSPHQFPDLAIGPNGHVYVVYQANLGGINRVVLKHSDDYGVSWEDAISVDSSSPTSTQWRPSIAVSDSGKIHVVWIDFRYDNSTIFSAFSNDNGTTFSTGVEVSNSRINGRYGSDIAVGGNGNVYISWFDNRNYPGLPPGSDFDVFFSRSTNGGVSFQADISIEDSPSGVDSYSPSIVSDKYGRVYIVWSRDSRIYFDRSMDDGLTFGTDLLISKDLEDTSRESPSITASRDGQNLITVWSDNRGGDFDVYTARSINGGLSFGDDEYLIDDSSGISGVWDNNEAILLDNLNCVLDAGVLNGIDSPDNITTPGLADISIETENIYRRLSYYDSNLDNGWDAGEDIVFSTWVPQINPKFMTAWDNTGDVYTDLFDNNPTGYSFFYTVPPTSVMGVDEWDISYTKLAPEQVLDQVQIKVVYSTDAGYSGGQDLMIDLGTGNLTTSFTPVDTGGVEVIEYIDILGLGADTIGELTTMDVSFVNDDLTRSVHFDQLNLLLRIQRFNPDVDTIIYSGGAVELRNVSLTTYLTPLDRIVFLDTDHDGIYDFFEPLILTSSIKSSGSYLDENDEVLETHGNFDWIVDMNQFPVNPDTDGIQNQGAVSMAGNVVYFVWSDEFDDILLTSFLNCVTPVIFLQPGWNLISILTNESDWSIESIFLPVISNIDMIQTYESISQRWLTYSPNDPIWLNSLTTVNNEMGIWVHIQGGEAVILPLFGPSLVETTNIILKKGWNLVGYPYLDAPKDVTNALAGIPWDIIQIGDQTRPYNLRSVSGSYIMETGKGYWVHVSADCIWAINN